MASTPKKKSETPDDDSGEVYVHPGSESNALPRHADSVGTIVEEHEDGSADILVLTPDGPEESVLLAFVQPCSESVNPSNYGGHLYTYEKEHDHGS